MKSRIAEISLIHRREFERYEWLVSLLLGTSRLILQQFKNDDYWWTTIERNIAYHAQYLVHRGNKKGADNDYIFSYGAEVTDMVKTVIAELCRRQVLVRPGRDWAVVRDEILRVGCDWDLDNDRLDKQSNACLDHLASFLSD